MIERPIAAKNIELFNSYGQNIDKYLLGSIEKDRYVVVDNKKGKYFLSLLKDLDGKNDIDKLAQKWKLSKELTIKIVEMFNQRGLLESSRDCGDSEIKKLSFRVCSISLKKLSFLNEKMAELMIKMFWIIFGAVLLSDFYFILIHKGDFCFSFKLFDSYIVGLLFASIIMIPSFLFHELCHAITSYSYGIKPERIDICLYMFLFPLFYVKIKGLYTVEPKKRVRIMSAGMIGNSFLGAVAVLLYFITNKAIFLAVLLSQMNIIIANINPFILSDGYYLMTIFFKTENMRKKMFDIIANLSFKKYSFKDGVYKYMLLNLGIVGFQTMYISNMSTNIISEVLNTTSTKKVGVLFNLFIFVIYLLCVHYRYKDSHEKTSMI